MLYPNSPTDHLKFSDDTLGSAQMLGAGMTRFSCAICTAFAVYARFPMNDVKRADGSSLADHRRVDAGHQPFTSQHFRVHLGALGSVFSQDSS